MSLEPMKRAAAAEALKLVRPGMRLGLGTGSTARHFVDLLGEAVKNGLDVVGVPTSEATRKQAISLGIPLSTLDQLVELDLTIDGADEIDADLNLIKGGGGAHLREKIVASASKAMIVIADTTKVVGALGRFPLPVEIVRFGEAAPGPPPGSRGRVRAGDSRCLRGRGPDLPADPAHGGGRQPPHHRRGQCHSGCPAGRCGRQGYRPADHVAGQLGGASGRNSRCCRTWPVHRPLFCRICRVGDGGCPFGPDVLTLLERFLHSEWIAP